MQKPNNQRITIDEDACNKCKQCEHDCTSLAIHIDTKTIDNTCILCGHCVAICKQQAIRIDNKPVKKIEKQSITPQEFKTLCAHTRTCRHYTSQSVSQDIINDILSNISLYPSASNTRKVEVCVITNPQMIEDLNNYTAQKLLRIFSFYGNPLISFILQLFVSSNEIRKIKHYKKSFLKKMSSNSQNITYKAPIVFIFHAKKQASGMLQTDADIWATYTSLLCSSYGLGTCFNGFIVKSLQNEKKAKKMFGIPQENTVFISLLAGYPKYSYCNEPGER